jgi:2-polyprenyl-6-methoxyphenol hydroxylase-like FAD-dependent oxidoreductase
MSELDCLVVGAGPTGLTLAGELLRHGASVRIIDAAPVPSPLSRAIVIHARTLEIFTDLGIDQEIVAAGLQLSAAELRLGGAGLVRFSFEELDTRYCFALALAQQDTERILGDLVARRGGAVERGTALASFEQDHYGVACTLRGTDGSTEQVKPRWLIGCDGAHSVVRKGLGLGFEGDTMPESAWLADVQIGWDLPRDRITINFGDDGVLGCFPMPRDRWRLIATRPDFGGDPEDALSVTPPSLDELREVAEHRAGRPCPISDPVWIAAFRVNTRQVTSYRAGRVFVAGDAAHIHSPVGGQGMNTGIQDAHNLGWKLGMVCTHKARAQLLDSYHAERHHIGAALLRATELATRVAAVRNPVGRAVRDRLAKVMASLEVVQHRIARSVAELDLAYRHSPIVSDYQGSVFDARLGSAKDDESASVGTWRDFRLAPHAGERVPDGSAIAGGATVRLSSLLGGGRHVLLLFDGRATTADGYANLVRIAREIAHRWPTQVMTHVVVGVAARPAELPADVSVLLDPEGDLEYRFGAASECLYLVRPDLYIGFRSQPAVLEPLCEHLSELGLIAQV